jgi:hypothetical protein
VTKRIEKLIATDPVDGTPGILYVVDGETSRNEITFSQYVDNGRRLFGVYIEGAPQYDVELYENDTLSARVGPKNPATDAMYDRIAYLNAHPEIARRSNPMTGPEA